MMTHDRHSQRGNAAGWLLIIILIIAIIAGYLWRQNGGSLPLPGDDAPPADEAPADDFLTTSRRRMMSRPRRRA